ncbi:MAG: DUF488 family protein [Corynebacterium provencense]|jgi:uncharacterized protein YeaO (DUF488 family)|uniref:DUF488 domain-containing protein n=1 Tax=Corynebacterium provencense TaxID=1737425 RepID=UPI002989BE10|nr:DUF488 family protein [Corynebacterium provencense]
MADSDGQGHLSIDRVYDARRGEGAEGVPDGAATFLVDRLWPRGVKKTDLRLTGWPRELTPSTTLRRQLHDGTLTWEQFGDAYRTELDGRHSAGELDDILTLLRQTLSERDVVLLFAGRDTVHTHARVLEDWLDGVL